MASYERIIRKLYGKTGNIMTDEERVQKYKGQYLKAEPKKKQPIKRNSITAKVHLSFLSSGGKFSRHSGAQ